MSKDIGRCEMVFFTVVLLESGHYNLRLKNLHEGPLPVKAKLYYKSCRKDNHALNSPSDESPKVFFVVGETATALRVLQ